MEKTRIKLKKYYDFHVFRKKSPPVAAILHRPRIHPSKNPYTNQNIEHQKADTQNARFFYKKTVSSIKISVTPIKISVSSI